MIPLFVCLLLADINAQISRLDLNNADLKAVIQIFGEPERYVWGSQTFTRDKLPERYLAVYPQGFMFAFAGGRLFEVRHSQPGYRFRDKIQVGSTREELFALIGKPARTQDGAGVTQAQAGVYYTNFLGRQGTEYWSRPDLQAAFWFREGKVASIVQTAKPEARRGGDDPLDFRGADLTAQDFRDRARDLFNAMFDTRTRWPAADRLPRDFEPRRVMELGRGPGLGVRELHKQGITGRGVAIAMLDQPLPRNHREYASRLRLYEEVNVRESRPQMHGAACLSIAAGETVGVAPEASLYYIGVWPANPDRSLNFKHLATALRRVLKVNAKLPAGEKIRVVSMQIGWDRGQEGFEEMEAAAAEAKAGGLLVASSSIERVHGLKFHGLGRHPLEDPEQFASYEPGLFWLKSFAAGRRFSDRLLVPMDSRATAGPNSPDEYVFYRQGGWSWSIPYLAGLYALAVQVDPGITPERFWATALRTGRTIAWKYEGKDVPLGPIVDPAALVAALKKR